VNASVNCLDRHVRGSRRTKAALIWEGEPGDSRVLTYWGLYREVNRFAAALRKGGVKKGDIVTIYMPMIPEVRSRSSRAPESGHRTPLSSQDSRLNRCAIVSMTPSRAWSSRRTEDIAAVRL
jgi:hypothetical protein